MNVATSGVDFALVAIFLFFGFFVGLILHLRREDRREGYPLEEDPSGRVRADGGLLFSPVLKTFLLPGGHTVTVPKKARDQRHLAARRSSIVPGSPLIPTGNPMVDGIGPAAYAERAKVPELSAHGTPKIVPMRVANDFSIAKGDPDPRGMTVLGLDGEPAGTVTDVWVDRPEAMIRYLEVALAGGLRTVILPMTMAVLDRRRKCFKVDAITAAQFAAVPALVSADQITRDEEERVTAYYGGGYLYATPKRLEPVL